MIQRHSILLWKKAEKIDKDFDEIARETYEILMVFQQYPEEIRPNFLSGKTKATAQKFNWIYENFRTVLRHGVNREDATVFEDLGYSVSFFSSINDHESCGFEITVGNKNESFFNTIIVNVPLALNLYTKKDADMISSLFQKLVLAYRPYWGIVSNKVLSRKYGKHLNEGLPATVQWINYWSPAIINKIGMEKIHTVLEKNRNLKYIDGILSIKETALDMTKEEDIRLQDELQKTLLK